MRAVLQISLVVALALPIMIYILIAHKRINIRTVKAFIVLYSLGVLYLTVLRRTPSDNPEIDLRLFWSYQDFYRTDVRWQVYMNILVFIPFGFLLHLSFRTGFWKTIIIGMAYSVIIEAIQFIFHLGLCEVDDIINNTLGTAIGYGYCMLVEKV